MASEADVAADPAELGIFGPFRDVEGPHFVPDLIEEFGLFCLGIG
jgi:hypothetical protein